MLFFGYWGYLHILCILELIPKASVELSRATASLSPDLEACSLRGASKLPAGFSLMRIQN